MVILKIVMITMIAMPVMIALVLRGTIVNRTKYC